MSDAVTRLNAALEGRYRIERQLGEGGMATVYLADDLRHERKVALKVLKPELAAVVGADRFLAEIKTTANLQHPHILPLFDSGEADSFLFYVMPYVEGESLRERLDREHQLPVDVATQIATNVAEALEHAHKHGVIHRDIKPANILLQDGKPVVSDFGIALAVSAGGGGRLTETGLSLGTPHYMSPEQATGDTSVGPATDIYALGCVLYEMLVGEPPYTGSTPQAILGKIIQAEPVSATKARRTVPTHLDAVIRKALEKVPADRFTGAHDLVRALTDQSFAYGSAATGRPLEAAGGWNRRAGLFAALFGVTAVLLVWSFFRGGPAAPPAEVVRFTVPVGEGADVWLGGTLDARWGRPAATSLALSPDGRLLAYAGWLIDADGTVESRLYLRRLGREEALPVAGTEGASAPFFSPDGAWIGFFDSLTLRRTPVAGGGPETVAQLPGPTPLFFGASWGEDGSVAFGAQSGIFRVPATGGMPEALVTPDTAAGGYQGVIHPEWLPGGRAMLYVGARSTAPDAGDILALDLETGERKTLLERAWSPRYVDGGILLFVRDATLMAVAFDSDALEVRGEPVAMVENVMQAFSMPNSGWETAAPQVAVARSGHLAYADGGTYPLPTYGPERVRPDGSSVPLGAEPRRYLSARVSPDGRRVALDGASSNPRYESFVLDLDRGVTQRFAPPGFDNVRGPVWSPDGRFLAFAAPTDAGRNELYRSPVDGSGAPERIAPSEQGQLPMSWSSTGVLAYLDGGDLWTLAPDGDPTPFTTSETERGRAGYAAFSPDGRWLAYAVQDQTANSGSDVYVRPYPGPGPPTLVSPDNGLAPSWSADGRRLFYRETVEGRAPRIVAVDVDTSDGFRVGRPVPLIDPWPYLSTVPFRSYDVMADGSFIAFRPQTEAERPTGFQGSLLRIENRVGEVHVVLNWFEELRERVPTN